MIVYLSGRITGMRNENRRNFTKEQNKIESALAHLPQLHIVNPNQLAEIVRLKFAGINQNRYKAIKPQWSDYMRHCISKLCEAQCAYFMKGWQKSKGATLERHIAKTLGIPCAESVEDLLKIHSDLYGSKPIKTGGYK
jgi:hypothetical protein